jgi:hypothetical protein
MMTMRSVPTEPGCYLVISEDVGEVAEWSPRLAGVHAMEDVLAAMRAALTLAPDVDAALQLLARRPVDIPPASRFRLTGAGLVTGGGGVPVEITERGRLALAIAAALRRSGEDAPSPARPPRPR